MRQDPPRFRLVEAARLVSFAYAGLAGGLALFVALVVYLGVGEIARTLASAGVGLLWVSLFHLVPIGASALGWYAVLAPVERPALRTVVSARWIAESINQLLPALHVGGNVVRARRLARSGVPATLAGASVVVDITLHLFAQLLFTMLGLSLLLVSVSGAGLDVSAIAGLVLSAVGAAAFFLMQRRASSPRWRLCSAASSDPPTGRRSSTVPARWTCAYGVCTGTRGPSPSPRSGTSSAGFSALGRHGSHSASSATRWN